MPQFRHPGPSSPTLAALAALPFAVLAPGVGGMLHAAEDQPAGSPPAEQTVTVVARQLDQARNQLSPTLGASTYEIGPRQLESQSQGLDAPFNQVLLRVPGVAQDSFGQLHVRGEHANLQYRINGVLLPEGLSGFGQELDTRFADHLTVITGALPAQYGLRTAGVVDITSKDGAGAAGGTLSLRGGSDDTIRPAVEYGGTAGDVQAYATASHLHSSLGIENPTDGRHALHDGTDQDRGFAQVSWILDPQSRVSVILSGAQGRFAIPDNPGQEPAFTLDGTPTADSATLDERQRETNAYAVVAWQRSAVTLDWQAAGFVRHSALRFTPDRDGDLIFNGVASTADLSALSLGAQLDGSLRLDDRHTLRGGATLLAQHAVSDTSTLVFPVDPGTGAVGTAPATIVDDQAEWGHSDGVYVQDEWRIAPRWTVNAGARFDAVDAHVREQQLSPRLTTTVQIADGTAVHVGYARYFTPPPLESVQQTTIARFAGTTNAAANPRNDPVRAERAHYVDAGISQQLGAQARIGVDGYWKRATHQLDEGQFGSAVIFTPFNYREGTVRGVELSGTWEDETFAAYGNVALSRATGTGIESAQFDFDPDELAYIDSHDVHLDHDQRWTMSGGAAWRVADGLRVMADALYGSGLRKGFANTGQVPSYVTVNLGLAYTWRGLTASFDVVNVLDRVYQLRDGSGIGVGAPQFGQRRGYYGGLAYAF